MIYKITFFILLTVLFIKTHGSTFGVNYSIKFKGFERYEGIKNSVWDLKDIRMKKINKTHYAIDGAYSVLRDNIPSDSLLMSLHVAQKKANGFQESSLVQLHKRNYCEMWNNEKLTLPGIKQCINVTDYKCPPATGHYALVNYIPDTDKLPPNVPEGLWRITFEYYDKDTLIAGYRVFAELKRDSATDVIA